MTDIAQLADDEPMSSHARTSRRPTTKWRDEALKIWDMVAGYVVGTTMFLVALEIHWGIHRFFGG
jgi:hypothetical protein